jgi:uncharacterized membrane protein YjgN (DUF898 family)
VTDQRFVPPPIRDPVMQAALPLEMPGATKSEATTVFVLGLLGIVLCQLLAPFAWKKGNTYMSVCMIHGIQPDGLAVAGRILGMIGTVLLGLSLLWFLLVLVMAVASH